MLYQYLDLLSTMRKPELQAFFLPQRGACRAVVRVSEAEDFLLRGWRDD
jgi:hypothetical protein